jgi:uncharacterized protein
MKENLYTKNCIRTYTGRYVDVFNPKPEDIDIRDIAHALSYIPRFGGHLPWFRSVAEHSIDAAYYANHGFELEALLHDASEAYLGDMASPIKYRIPDYKIAEQKMMECISYVFGFEYPLSHEVHRVDRNELHKEWDNIMLNKNRIYIWWKRITYSHKRCERRFLRAYQHYRIKQLPKVSGELHTRYPERVRRVNFM